MSVDLDFHHGGKVVEVTLTGKLTKEDYEHFVPEIEEKIKECGPLRMIVRLEDFHGWELAAAWEDLKFDLHHWHDIERLGIIGESMWQKGMAMFCKPFTGAEIRSFEPAELDDARHWANLDD